MWNDIETTNDYLHFSVVSGTVADLIIESGDNPISIGVSGNWGSGKSSMVKMIGKELEKKDDGKQKYLFLEFNAWLYQGYDDAKAALLQAVTKKLSDEMKKRKINESTEESDKKLWNRFKKFAKRVDWFKVSKLTVPLLAGLVPGAMPAGALATLFFSVKDSVENQENKDENAKAISASLSSVFSGFEDILKDEDTKTATQQIEELRSDFEEILEKLDIKLVVLVDDLDRCLPETAVSTLEAMRLLLFVKRTSFIIAADEQMIRNGVRVHFGNVDLSDDLVTSYFDKLIQVPITVPRLGIPEVKAYMYLLFLEMEVRKGKIQGETQNKLQKQLEDALSKAWEKGVSLSEIQKKIENDQERQEMEEYVSVSEQLAGILVTSNKIKGNPRLIKRFLNALEIRKKVANLNGITVDLGILVKMLLFERCASQGAFDYLAEIVSKTTDGKPDKIKEIESDLEREKEYHAPDPKWNDEFIKEWVLLSPRLSDYDLRLLLYLSRDKSITLAGYDKISPAGEEIFKALQANKGIIIKRDLVEKISQLGQEESEAILQRLLRMGRSDQWTNDSLGRAFHIIEAYPDLGSQLAVELTSLPCVARKPALVTAIKEKAWAKELIEQWEEDSNTPAEAKKILSRR